MVLANTSNDASAFFLVYLSTTLSSPCLCKVESIFSFGSFHDLLSGILSLCLVAGVNGIDVENFLDIMFS